MKNLLLVLAAIVLCVVFLFIGIQSTDLFLNLENQVKDYFGSWMSSIKSDGSDSNTQFFSIFFFVYTFVSGLPFITLPSEIGILYIDKLGFITPLIASASGKAIVTIAVSIIIQFSVGGKGIKSAKRLNFEKTRLYSLLSGKFGGLIYFICQSVPFFPMRSSTAAYAFIVKPSWAIIAYVGIASFLGTVIRMLLLYALLILGYDFLVDLKGI